MDKFEFVAAEGVYYTGEVYPVGDGFITIATKLSMGPPYRAHVLIKTRPAPEAVAREVAAVMETAPDLPSAAKWIKAHHPEVLW